jgi:glutamyl endopeptidase
MANVIPVTGLHIPITNVVIGEATIETPRQSPGSIGYGNEHPIESGAKKENLPRMMMETVADGPPPEIPAVPDIGEASFGLRKTIREIVIGTTDERVRINDTTQFPWRCTASLLITAADNTVWSGSAWFISSRTLITAGHCVFVKDSVAARSGWVKSIQVMPGRNGNTLPFGGKMANEFWTVKGWAENGLENYDYGSIILPAAFEPDLGYMGFGVYADQQLLRSVANIEGYPTDKPKGSLWYDSRQISDVKPDKVYYAADTAGGQSGSAVYIIENGQRISIGIHAYGGDIANSGTRISSQVFTNMESWKR